MALSVSMVLKFHSELVPAAVSFAAVRNSSMTVKISCPFAQKSRIDRPVKGAAPGFFPPVRRRMDSPSADVVSFVAKVNMRATWTGSPAITTRLFVGENDVMSASGAFMRPRNQPEIDLGTRTASSTRTPSAKSSAMPQPLESPHRHAESWYCHTLGVPSSLAFSTVRAGWPPGRREYGLTTALTVRATNLLPETDCSTLKAIE